MVQTSGLDKLLKEHPFFKDMDGKSLKTLTGCAKNERFEAGEIIAREGEDANKFYVIRAGTIAIEFNVPGRGEIIVETLSEGEILGWAWMVEPYTWSSDVRAKELTRVVSLDVACLRKKLDKDHTLGFDLYSRFTKIMARHLHTAHLQMSDMFGNGVK